MGNLETYDVQTWDDSGAAGFDALDPILKYVRAFNGRVRWWRQLLDFQVGVVEPHILSLTCKTGHEFVLNDKKKKEI